VAKSSSPVSGVAERYAASLHDLAAEIGAVDQVESDLDAFEALLTESQDLARLIRSPVFSAEDQFRAISAIMDRVGFTPLVGNFLKVVARNRRLFAVPAMIKAFRRIAAEQRGEVSAEVTVAHALAPDQEAELMTTLREMAGKKVSIKATVDPSLLGGLIVRIGSRQIDSSLRTKLNSLKLALKEVG
jgi:F-type H+-transporting ATPase subunit delta